MPTVRISDLVGGGYNDFWNCRKRYRVIKGSRGSKKSKTAALNRIFRILKYPECNYLCVRRYSNTLRDSIFADTKWAIDRLGVDSLFRCTVSPMEIIRIDTGQKILFRGLDEGTKVTSITVNKGALNYVDIEEAYEIYEDDFDKLDMSIRGELPSDDYFKQITLLFNPWSETSWLKARFFDEEDDEVFTQTTTWECNEWLDDADRKIFMSMKEKNPRRYQIEGLGQWGITDGLIYNNYVVEDFDLDALIKMPGIKSAYGLDFGYTDPNAFVCSLIDDTNKIIYVFDEWYKVGVTNSAIAKQIKLMGYGSEKIVCDCAEPKSIAELYEEGLRPEPSRKGKDSVLHGIQLIQNYKIIIKPTCREFQKEIGNYCWIKDRNGKSTDKPDHEFSHGMDALRYAVSKAVMPDTFSFE